jgi:hypothetical protein
MVLSRYLFSGCITQRFGTPRSIGASLRPIIISSGMIQYFKELIISYLQLLFEENRTLFLCIGYDLLVILLWFYYDFIMIWL